MSRFEDLAERALARPVVAPGARTPGRDAKSSADLDALIERVDAALGEDQLL